MKVFEFGRRRTRGCEEGEREQDWCVWVSRASCSPVMESAHSVEVAASTRSLLSMCVSRAKYTSWTAFRSVNSFMLPSIGWRERERVKGREMESI